VLHIAFALSPTTFGVAVVGVVLILVTASLLYRHPTRQCHRCGKQARLDQRICRECGYDFEPISYGR
jgi:predicted amidophosphoribosyltransferase